MCAFWLLDVHKFEGVTAFSDEPWELVFTDLAEELFKVIVKSTSCDFLFDLGLNPLLQTLEVDESRSA